MDSLTQIVLGAGVGEAVLGRKIGNKAMLWGAVGGTIPDLDVMFQGLTTFVYGLSWHRGFSHSIIFFLLVSPILGFLVSKIYKKKEANFREWTWFFFAVTFTHALLDCFTSWGTQLFWPHPWRVRFNNIFVADLLYTVPFLMCVIAAMFYTRTSRKRRKINNFGLIISSIYMLLTLLSKYVVYQDVKDDLLSRSVQYQNLSTRPTPLNAILWAAAVERENDYMLGYRSLLDQTDSVQWSYIDKNWEVLEPYRGNDELERLLFLTQGHYVARKKEEGILIHDLRFGQPEGIMEDEDRFVFSYLVKENEDGSLLIDQYNSPEPKWEEMKPALKQLIERLKGI